MTRPASTPPADARRYATLRYRLLLLEQAVWFIFLGVFQASGASWRLAGWWGDRAPQAWALIAGYLAGFGSLYYLVTLPLRVCGSFRLERRFGLSRLTAAGWLKREAKRLAVTASLSGVLLEGLYTLFRYAPTSWPAWATVGWVAVTVGLARIFPTVLLPLFYKTVPLPDEALARRLLDLCRRAGLGALGVFRFDLGVETRKANAALAGLGASRRVLVSDTLVGEFSPEEVEGVLAHEVAHHRYHHITKLLVVSAVGAWIAFTLTAAAWRAQLGILGEYGLAEIAGFPILMAWFSALGLVAMPLQHAFSRGFEWQADRAAVELTARPRAFADALRRLARLNLADPDPPRWVVWWFYDHPPISERIAAAERAAHA